MTFITGILKRIKKESRYTVAFRITISRHKIIGLEAFITAASRYFSTFHAVGLTFKTKVARIKC